MRFLKELAQDLYLPKPPAWAVYIALILVSASWIPLAFIAKARVSKSGSPPVQFFQDMFNQPKFTTQKTNAVFADNRAMRHPVPGTVSRDVVFDDHFTLGYHTNDNGQVVTYQTTKNGQTQTLTKFYKGYPKQVAVDQGLLLRGREQFNVYCYPCHGLGGQGDGPVGQRAAQLQELGATQTSWVPASNLVQATAAGLIYGQKNYSNGKLFNVINNGIRNMPGYKSQITPEDRWAIVAYVRALQLSQYNVSASENVSASKSHASP